MLRAADLIGAVVGTRSGPRRRRVRGDDGRSARGQVAVLSVAVLVALLGVAALVVDVGRGYLTSRRAQAAADASALAAAQVLPDSDRAREISADLASRNYPSADVGLTVSTTYAPSDTANTYAQVSVLPFFARLLGFGAFTAGARATAVIASYVGWANTVAPWATDRASITYGAIVSFKVSPGSQASSGNFGGVSLPVQEKGCEPTSGANEYRRLITGTYRACLVQVGDLLDPEPGNMAFTGKALEDRGAVRGFDPGTILRTGPTGQPDLTVQEHPNLVVIPVVSQFYQGSSNPLTVTGFAWFIITDYTKDSVSGMFVRSGLPGGATCPTAGDSDAPCPLGAYDPDGLRVVTLVA